MHRQAVLFDLDGTLIDTLPLIECIFKKVFQEFNLPWQNGLVLQSIGLPLQEIVNKHAPPGQVEQIRKRYTELQDAHSKDWIKAYPGTIEILQRIKEQHLLTAVVTSKRRKPALQGMNHAGIKPYIDLIIAEEDAQCTKPDPAPINKALQILNINPLNAIFIGDSWYDVMAAKGAKVDCCAVTWGMASKKQLQSHAPAFLVDTWKDFWQILTENGYLLDTAK